MKIPIRILMERYQNHLYRIAFSICQNREDAEDVVQDTFPQYHILKKEFEDETHIRAWLMRVAINKSRNIVRAFWRKHRQSLESYMEELDFPDTESVPCSRQCCGSRRNSAPSFISSIMKITRSRKSQKYCM